MYYRFTVLRLLSLVCFVAPTVHANDDDTRFLQEQTRRQIEQQAQSDQQLGAPFGALLYEGQHYHVPDQLDALEPAIYIAINTNQWALLPDFIRRYRQFPQHRPALAAMAESLLARSTGDYPLALQKMEYANQQEPNDARILLELSRLWFEDNQDTRAREGFAQAMQAGLPQHAQLLIQQYKQALNRRDAWQGSVAIGGGRNNNINQANGYQRCEAYIPVLGICAFERKMPAAIAANMLSYELSLQRRINVSGNHNVQIKPISHGTYYTRTNPNPQASIHNYSNNLALLYVGYQYMNARTTLTLSPYAEHYYRNRAREYMAYGIQTEWRHAVTPRWQLSSNLDYKRYRYANHAQYSGANHHQKQWGAFVTYLPSARTNLYGGVNFSRKKYTHAQASNKEWSARGGVYHAFSGRAGLFVNAVGIYRIHRNNAYDFFFDERRRDKQRLYIVSAGFNQWKIAGLQPELRLRHTINHSNVGWAFSYKQSEVSLFLRKVF